MAKQKKTSKADEDILKHYISFDGDRSEGIDPALLKQPHIKELLDRIPVSKPKYVKAKITVDRIMSGRKNAVIKDPGAKNNT